MRRKNWIFIGIVFLMLLLYSMLFQVDETQITVVTQFGNPVRFVTNPGLYIKLPYPFQSKIIFDKRIQVFDLKPMEFLTGDKQNIIAHAFINWRIDKNNVGRFLKSLRQKNNAEMFLTDILISELGASLGRYKMDNLVSVDTARVKIDEMMNNVTSNCKIKSKVNGLEIMSVRLAKLNLPDQNKYSVYDRMAEERKRIARKYRAEGEEIAMGIMAEADKNKIEITSAAQKDADIIKGQGEAEAMKIYSKAYSKNPEFYKFLRTLEAYEKFVNDKTTIVLSPNSELMHLLSKGK